MYEQSYIGLPLSFLTEERVSSLILEGKDPVELLKYKFSNIPEDIIEDVVSIDPTKKKSYSQWLLKHWKDEQGYIENGLKNGNIKRLFDYVKGHQDVELKDISSVEEGVKMYVGEDSEEDSVLDKPSGPTEYVKNLHGNVDSELANDFEIVFNEDNWLIAVPNTYEASCKLGEGMKWCTANAFGNGESYYNQYLSKGGKYYVNFDMSEGEPGVINKLDYPYTRYQFHFETRQFKDSHDDSVSLGEIGMPDSANEFYINEGYDIEEYAMTDEEKYERYLEARDADSMEISETGLWLKQAYSQDFELEEGDNIDYYLYDENDDEDAIDWVEFSKSKDIIKLSNGVDLFVLEQKDGNYAIVYNDNKSQYSRSWNLESVEFYTNEGNYVMGINDDSELFYTDTEFANSISLGVEHKYEMVFLNKYIDNENDYAEAVTHDGFHTLIRLYPDPEVVIKLDIPKNKKMFVSDDDFRVEAQFRTYYFGEGNEDDGEPNFQVVKSVGENRVLVQLDGNEQDCFNIWDTESRKYICPFNFSDLAGINPYCYIVKTGGRYYFISLDGNQIGEGYMLVGNIKFPYVYGDVKSRVRDIINLEEQKVKFRCRSFNTHLGLIGNSIICVDTEKNTGILVDISTGEQVLSGYSNFERVGYGQTDLIIGKKEGENGGTAFDRNELQPLFNNIKTVSPPNYRGRPCKVQFIDGTYNLYDQSNKKMVLPSGVTYLESGISEEDAGIYPYEVNGLLYILDYATGQNLINPNGMDPKGISELGVEKYSAGKIYIMYDGIEFRFSKNGRPVSYRPSGDYHDYTIASLNDPKIAQALSVLTGQDYGKNLKESIKKEFDEKLKKLWMTH
jgi:hypothetical protein